MSTAVGERTTGADAGRPSGRDREAGGEWRGSSLSAVVALVAVAAGVVALVLPGGAVRLVLVLAFTLLGPGCGLMSLVRVPSELIRWGLALTASTTAVMLLSAAMIWTATWHPLALHLVLLAVTVVLGVLGLARQRGQRPPARDHEVAGEVPGGLRRWAPHVLLAAAVVLWLVAMSGFSAARLDDYGLTKALGVPYVLAVVLPGAAFVLEVFGPARRYAMAASAAVLLLISRGTPSFLLPMAQYPWTYKHIGVVELFQQSGRVLDARDIYQQWPSFFTGVAQVSAVGEHSALGMAEWSPLWLAVVQTLLVAAAARALTGNRRVVAATAMVFAVAEWGDTLYFSPQATAYCLAFGLMTIFFLWLRSTPDAPTGSRLSRLCAVLARGAAEGPVTTRGQRAGAMLAAAAVFLAITTSHQLTPFLVLAPLVLLGVLGVFRPFWFLLVLAAMALGYVLLHQGVVGEYKVFTGFDIFSNASGNTQQSWGSSGQAFSALVVRGMAFVLWGVTLLVAVAQRRQFGRVLVPLAMAFVPFVFGLAGNYGGELVYRLYAFSLPWCAFVLVQAVRDRRRMAAGRAAAGAPRPRVRVTAGVLSALLLGTYALASLQNTEGQLVYGVMTKADVAASEYFYAHAPDRSVVVQVTPGFPMRVDARYRVVNEGRSVDPSLTDEPELRNRMLDARALPAVTDFVNSFEGTSRYLVISDNMAAQARYFGYLPEGSIAALEGALRSSPQWRVFYQNADVTVFEQQTAP